MLKMINANGWVIGTVLMQDGGPTTFASNKLDKTYEVMKFQNMHHLKKNDELILDYKHLHKKHNTF